MGNETTAIAVTEATVAEYINHELPSLKGFALRNYDQTAWAKTAMLAIADNRALLECLSTKDGRQSLHAALRYAASTG